MHVQSFIEMRAWLEQKTGSTDHFLKYPCKLLSVMYIHGLVICAYTTSDSVW